MINIELQHAAEGFMVPEEALFQTWAHAIQCDNEEKTTAAIRIVSESEMSQLNQHYRQKHGPTNVLSFPANLHEDVDVSFIGDVVICAPVVINEAIQQGKIEQSHWAHMTVHGILHLLGYDHENENDAEVMEAREIQIMQKLGFNNPYCQ